MYCAPRTGHKNGFEELGGLMITYGIWKPEDRHKHQSFGISVLGVTSSSAPTSRILNDLLASPSPWLDTRPQTPQA